MNKSYYYKEGGGATFRDESGELHSFRDFDLILRQVEVTEPEPQTNFIEIPFRNGSLDLSEPYGEENIAFRDRFLYLTFTDLHFKDDFLLRISEFSRFVLGKRRMIILDKDPAYYYIGRCTEFSDIEQEGNIATVTITFEVEPYRYANCSADSPWLWDPFSFETDMAIDTGNYLVDQTFTKIINPGENSVVPTFIVDSDMTVDFNGKTYELKTGTNINYDIRLKGKTLNVLVFHGTGSVIIDYKGGRF